jgi:hypothetical protein
VFHDVEVERLREEVRGGDSFVGRFIGRLQTFCKVFVRRFTCCVCVEVIVCAGVGDAGRGGAGGKRNVVSVVALVAGVQVSVPVCCRPVKISESFAGLAGGRRGVEYVGRFVQERLLGVVACL